MEAQGSSHDTNLGKDLIGSATSVEEIIDALAMRGCSNLTSSIDSTACSDFACAGGGFCDVYQGVLDDGTKLAIKALRIYSDVDRQKVFKRAARELYHWSKLQHRNVLPLMGLTVFQNRISMVSEWMENGSLSSYLKHNPNANRIRLCMDICEGLCYIHGNDMVHGDLKAANVMVSADGTALIADFGNAELRDLTLRFTNTSKVDLSVRWTAPELLVPEGKPRASKEADVYAFGMTALEALTGKLPFHGTQEYQIVRSVLCGRKVPTRPDIDIQDDLWNTLNRCWTYEPTERPRITSIRERLQALKDATPQSQGNEFISRRHTNMEEVAPGAHEMPLETTRKLAVGKDVEDDGGEILWRNMRPNFYDQNERYHYDEEEWESESEEEREEEREGKGDFSGPLPPAPALYPPQPYSAMRPGATPPPASTPVNPAASPMTATRRGRRESFGTQRRQKPPCLFFPFGRCRNGDKCRFPHVLVEPDSQPNDFRYPSNTTPQAQGNEFISSGQTKAPCLFFPLGRCRNGDECRFPHVLVEPDSQPNDFRYPSNNGGRFNDRRARQSIGHHDGPPPAHIPPGTKLPFAPGGHVEV